MPATSARDTQGIPATGAATHIHIPEATEFNCPAAQRQQSRAEYRFFFVDTKIKIKSCLCCTSASHHLIHTVTRVAQGLFEPLMLSTAGAQQLPRFPEAIS